MTDRKQGWLPELITLMDPREFVEARGATPDLLTTGLFHDFPNE